MNLRLLQDHITAFAGHLAAGDLSELVAWESQRIFQENWDLDAEDLHSMFDRSLDNSQSRRLWKSEGFSPKQRMLEFIELQPDLVRIMFRDLYQQEKDLEGRIDRFLFYCDELMAAYRETHPRTVENNHYHGDYRMIALYLAFRYPDQYALYDFESFRQTLRRLKSAQIPETHDLPRFTKVMRTIYQFLQKEEGLLEAHYRRLDPERHFMGNSLLLSLEFTRFCAR
ncbi:MAG: hypothetical protein KDC43_06815 [Saprospiraceae bacterium]|nr:hypothetical protein [Saprospiraceae bacterium]MCB0623622.1 hypothetical protein [Saprospiraceae bacterium]MCB0679308.1 hypothetical protein [Saprospiraceae bacterium]MCB0682344.1 hypothetical protein [Saprospiraceae bacterium]